MTTTITLSAFLVTLLISYLIPLVTALLTKVTASPTVKQLVTAFLAAVNGFVVAATQADGSALFTKEMLLFAVISFITANVGYISLWKPHAIDTKIAPSKGIGGGS